MFRSEAQRIGEVSDAGFRAHRSQVTVSSTVFTFTMYVDMKCVK